MCVGYIGYYSRFFISYLYPKSPSPSVMHCSTRQAFPPLIQMLYTIEGKQLRVAFVEENGGEGAVVNDLYQGDVAFFPQGLIHYQQNLDCEPATFLAALNSEDAGVVTITTNFFQLPSEAIQVSNAIYALCKWYARLPRVTAACMHIIHCSCTIYVL